MLTDRVFVCRKNEAAAPAILWWDTITITRFAGWAMALDRRLHAH
jgi:hypothetical protein